MNLRHTAALALVGWYLMLPPLGPSEKNFPVASDAPLAQWTNSGSFDTAKECEVERQKLSVDAKKRAAEAVRGPADKNQALAIGVAGAESLATCIETTDPRLKEESRLKEKGQRAGAGQYAVRKGVSKTTSP